MDSVATLIDTLRQCRVLDAGQLDELARKVLAHQRMDPRGLTAVLLKRGWLTPFQVNRLLAGRGSELLLGSYVLLDRLGEGGMGEVFKARNWKLGKLVALKLIRKELLTNATAVGRFRREIEVTAQLKHPNLIHAFDADETAAGMFIVMEYVEGIDLGRLVQDKGPLPVAEACDSIRQTALALQYAHEKGLIHRDVKPPNLLRAAEGHTIKLLDLGLARLQEQFEGALHANDRPALTQLGVIVGTVDFIAPEQARDSRGVDGRADLYGLGCTFHYLLTGRVPFPGGTPTEKLLKHTLEPPPAMPRIPPRVVAVVHRLMAKKPEDRYQTPAEVAAVLEGLLAVPGELSIPRLGDQLPPTVPNVQLPPAEAVAARSGRVSKAVPRVNGVRRTPTRPADASGKPPRLPRPAAEGAVAPVTPSRVLERTISPVRVICEPIPELSVPARPRPRRIVKVAAMALPLLGVGLLAVFGFRALAPPPPSVESSSGAPVKVLYVLAKQPGGRSLLAWSPDGKRLASVGNTSTIHLHNGASGALLQTLTAKGERVEALAWEPRANLLATVGRPARPPHVSFVQVWETDSVKERLLLKGIAGHVSCLALNGKLLAAGHGNGRVTVWDAFNGTSPGELTGHRKPVSALAFQGRLLASADRDGVLKLWDTEAGVSPALRLHTLAGHKGAISSLVFREDGRVLASAGLGGIVLWDTRTGKKLHRLASGKAAVVSLAFGPGERLAWSGRDGRVHLYDSATGTEKRVVALGARGLRLWPSFRDGGLSCAGSNGVVYHFPSLSALEESSTGAMLLPLLKDERPTVRLAAIRALAEQKVPEAEATLVALLRDAAKPLAERAAAAEVLARTGTQVSLQVESLRALGKLNAAAAGRVGFRFLESKNIGLQKEAVRALGLRPEGAKQAARHFLDGKLSRAVLPVLAEALRRHQAAAALKAVNRAALRGMVLEFWVTGPFGPDAKVAYPPEKNPNPAVNYAGPRGDKRFWTRRKLEGDPLLQPRSSPRSGGDFSYALVCVHSPVAQKIPLFVDARTQLRIWVNSKQVYETDQPSPALDEVRVAVSLVKGRNVLLIKYRGQGQRLREFFLRFPADARLTTSTNPRSP